MRPDHLLGLGGDAHLGADRAGRQADRPRPARAAAGGVVRPGADGGAARRGDRAEEGARTLARGLPLAVAEPANLAGRSDALLGAWLAGASLAAGVGIHHQLCHLLGGAYGLPHAELHTVLLPHAVGFVAPAAPGPVARLARALGVDDAAGGLWDLARRLGAPASLAELGLAAAELDRAAALAATRVAQTPRPAGIQELRGLLGDAWRGRRPSPA